MIHIKQFREDRDENVPTWKKAQEFLNEIGKDNIIHIHTYPTGPHHNLIVIYNEMNQEELDAVAKTLET